MAKLSRLTGKEVAKIVEKLGFFHSHTTGSHMGYRHSDGRIVVIPSHSGEEIGPGLLNKMSEVSIQSMTGGKLCLLLLPYLMETSEHAQEPQVAVSEDEAFA